MPEFYDHLTDVVVVGSGAAAAVTALAVKDAGLEPIILESTDLFGGSSAISGGGLWIPGSHVMQRAGVLDTPEAGSTYLNHVLDHHPAGAGAGEASGRERREAFLRGGPEMVAWLEDIGLLWRYGRGYPDSYPHAPGGSVTGRAIEARRYDLKRLGRWRENLRHTVRGVAFHATDAAAMATSRRSPRSLLTSAKAIGLHSVAPRLNGRDMVGLGNALMGRLLELLLDRTVSIRLESEVTDLIVREGRVSGVVVRRNGEAFNVGATHGVMIASGGFEKSPELRERFLPLPTSTTWSSGSPGNTGVPLEAAARVGARLVNMDSAWWGPTVIHPDGTAGIMNSERSLPHGIIVASDGRRFMNESGPSVDAGRQQYAKHREEGVSAIPAFHITDSRHRAWYPYGTFRPGAGTRKMVESGFMVRADTLEELARATGINPAGLTATVERFNAFAATGVDEEFGRGGNAHDRFYSDSRVRPNPTLGRISRAPFSAVRVYPGDLGTNGGILTDQVGRALAEDGAVIEGLYAAGNAAASVMGATYPGPGAPIAAAMVFGFLAGRHMSEVE
nr:FAD-binding protein [Actinomycetales bacterium]